MGNVPVQVIRESTPRWDQEKIPTIQKSDPDAKKAEPIGSIAPESLPQDVTDPQETKDTTTTITPERKPIVESPKVVSKTDDGVAIKTIALETIDTLTKKADEEEKELITGIVDAAHGTK